MNVAREDRKVAVEGPIRTCSFHRVLKVVGARRNDAENKNEA